MKFTLSEMFKLVEEGDSTITAKDIVDTWNEKVSDYDPDEFIKKFGEYEDEIQWLGIIADEYYDKIINE